MINKGIDAVEEIRKMTERSFHSEYTNLLEESFDEIEAEIYRAKEKYPDDFNSLHEAYAVILEEIDELWDEIKKKEPDMKRLREEAIQSAAMLCRLLVEIL